MSQSPRKVKVWKRLRAAVRQHRVTKFTSRWKKAKILVIGSAYGTPEYKRWAQIDLYYIGVGTSEWPYESVHLDENPYGMAWDIHIMQSINQRAKAGNKKFEAIYIDVDVSDKLPWYMLRAIAAGAALKPGGSLFVPVSGVQVLQEIRSRPEQWEQIGVVELPSPRLREVRHPFIEFKHHARRPLAIAEQDQREKQNQFWALLESAKKRSQ